jgi:hypothetical protein
MTCHQIVESDKTPLEIAPRSDDSLGGSLKLPDPWLFDSQALLRELDRIRETALQVPTNGDANATHFGLQLVINATWTLRENLRYILGLHRERQLAFGKKHKAGTEPEHQTIYDLPTVVRLARNKLLITLWTGYPTL